MCGLGAEASPYFDFVRREGDIHFKAQVIDLINTE